MSYANNPTIQPDENLALKDTARYTDLFSTIIPNDLTSHRPYMGPGGLRNQRRIPAVNQTLSSGSNRTARFELKSDTFLDGRKSFLSFKASATATAAVAFSNGIWNIINRIRVLHAGNVLIDEMDKNAIQSWIYFQTRNPDIDACYGSQLWGVASLATRQARAAAGHYYTIKTGNAWLDQNELPVWLFNGGLVLEITFEDPSAVLETAGVNAAWTIEDLTYVVDEVRYQQKIYENYIKDGIVYFGFDTYDIFKNTINATNNQLYLPCKTQGIKRLISFMRRTVDLNDTTVNNKWQTFEYGATNSFQTKVNNTSFPPDPVRAGPSPTPGYTEAYIQALEAITPYHYDYAKLNEPIGITDTGAVTDFNNKNFTMAQSFKTFLGNPTLITQFNTSSGNDTIYQKITLNGVPAADLQLYTFVIKTNVIGVAGGRSVVIN